MAIDFVYKNVTADNIEDEHICCAFASSKNKAGMLAKKSWMKERLAEGMVFRKLDEKAKVFIEYIPAEFAWKPVVAPGYLFIHCLWVSGRYKNNGHAKRLVEYCLEDAKDYKGVAVIAGNKAFLTGTDFYEHFGFEVVDSVPPYFSLMVRKNDPQASTPSFRENVRNPTIKEKGLLIQYTDQCPFASHYALEMKHTAENDFGINTKIGHIDSYEKSQNTHSPYGSFGVFLDGQLLTYQPMSRKGFTKLLHKVL